MKTNPNPHRTTALSLSETMVAVAALVVILSVLVLSALSLQKSFRAGENYALGQTATSRLIDYLDADLRNAVAISVNGSPFRSGEISLAKTQSLEITRPPYYQSNDTASPNFAIALPLHTVADPFHGPTLHYGPPPGEPTRIRYRYAYDDAAQSYCFIREENGHPTLLVEHADQIDCDLTMQADGRRIEIQTWFTPAEADSQETRVSSSSLVLLRNPRIDL